VLRDQDLCDFRMHDASWCRSVHTEKRVTNTMYLELVCVKIYLEIGLGLGLGYGPRVLGRASVITRLRHYAEGL
jgi:hypothetical protein